MDLLEKTIAKVKHGLANGGTMQGMARDIGMPRKTLDYIVKGRVKPRWDTLRMIGEYVGTVRRDG